MAGVVSGRPCLQRCGATLSRRAGRHGPRRPGDPATLIADVTRLRATLDWTPRHADLHAILRSALAWERRQHGSDPASRAAQR